MSPNNSNWFTIDNVADVPSPALLVYPERVEGNIGRMISIAGDVGRLRPHMKTHKMPDVIRLQLARGITKFKCSTIAEAEMTASSGGADVLLAYQPVGPNIRRLVELIRRFPQTTFSTIVDDPSAMKALAEAASAAAVTVNTLLDVDCGQHRTGVEAGPRAVELYRLIASSPGLKAGGLHVYDGHIHETDVVTRTKNYEAAFAPAAALREQLLQSGLAVPRVVAGGTPTFPMHARGGTVECSPGTCVFWDFGYATTLPDLDFLPAALVLTRVISKPGSQRLCLDLGHKAVAAENPHPRVRLLGLEDAKFVMHNEEHLVIDTSQAAEFSIGASLYGIPWHVCPTVALHSEAVVVRNQRAEGRWRVSARERHLSI
jgi:D-serine deaminase-like pyridoxal phosphate-dependent protein